MGKISCLIRFTLINFLCLGVVQLIILYLSNEFGWFLITHLWGFHLDYFSDKAYLWMFRIAQVLYIFIWFDCVVNLFTGYGDLYKSLVVFTVGQGEYTSSREKKKIKKKIINGVSWYVFYKHYLSPILWVAAWQNGIFYLFINEDKVRAIVLFGIFGLAGFLVHHLCGDYDEILIRIRETVDYEYRNRGRVAGMRNYINDNPPPPQPHYYQPPPQNYSRDRQAPPESLDDVVNNSDRQSNSHHGRGSARGKFVKNLFKKPPRPF